jgi:ribokinase
MSRILVIGSSNTDLIAKVARFPEAGETVQGRFFIQAMGGKGANQALAAHRLGGEVKFVTCLGNDANGENTLRYYKNEGLDISLSRTFENVPTGTAMILVNDEGENCIVITPGANNELSPGVVESLEKDIANAFIVVLQMEIPLETVGKVCALASKHGTAVLLNVAPAREIDPGLLKGIEFLVVNETEIETITKQSIASIGEEAVMDTLLKMGPKTVILTLGKNGSLVKNKNVSRHIPAFVVDTVDSTAAGDTFCGALVAKLSTGTELLEAVQFATAASAICVTKMGAQPSIPTEEEVGHFISQNVAVAGRGKVNMTNL